MSVHFFESQPIESNIRRQQLPVFCPGIYDYNLCKSNLYNGGRNQKYMLLVYNSYGCNSNCYLVI